MSEQLTTHGRAEDLTSDKAVAAFMAEAFATGDAGFVAHALGIMARQGYDAGRPRDRVVARTTLPVF